MDFFKKLFSWVPGASTSEKVMTFVGGAFFLALFIWLLLSAWGVGDNAMAEAARGTRPNAKVWGTLLLGATLFWAWWNWSDNIPWRINDIAAVVILWILLILSMLAYVGFYNHVYR